MLRSSVVVSRQVMRGGRIDGLVVARRSFETTSKPLVWLSETVADPLLKRKYGFRALAVAVSALIVTRQYSDMKVQEVVRSRRLEGNYRRSVGEIILTRAASMMDTNGLVRTLSGSSQAPLDSSQRRALYFLLLQTIEKHKAGKLTPEDAQQVLNSILPMAHLYDEPVRAQVAEIVLMYADSDLIVPAFFKASQTALNPEEFLDCLAKLVSAPTPEDLATHKSTTSSANKSVSTTLSKLLQSQPELAGEILKRQGLSFVTLMSENRRADKRFFAPFCSAVAEQAKDPHLAAEMVSKGLMEFLKNAISNEASEKEKVLLETSSSRNVKMYSYDDPLDIAARQQTYLEVARCLGNLAQISPEVSHVVVENGAIPILQTIYNDARDSKAVLQTARAIANLSSVAQNRNALIQAGWLSILEHWVSAECQRTITYKARKSISEILTKKDLLAGTANLEEISRDQRQITSISLVALANLAAQDSRAAEHISRSSILREVTDTLAKDNHDIVVKQQVSRLTAAMANHSDVQVNGRIQSQVGMAGFLILLKEGDTNVYYNVARTLAALVKDKPFARLIVEQDRLGWEIIEILSASSSLAVQNQVARTIANITAGLGGKSVNKKKEIKSLLQKWTKSSNKTLADNATRALASLMSDEASGSKYAEGVHLLHPQGTNFIEDETELDLVFVHGVGGNSLTTWRSGTDNETIWPRDWLPQEFPRIRVISLAYEMPISKWEGEALPLPDEALISLKKLKLANIGTRPVIFVTHSFGGLVVKQLLKFSSEDQRFSQIVENTKGVAFFSTPHRGAALASLADKVIFRRTAALDTLHPSSEELRQLHSDFEKAAPSIPTLSFGENDNTCVGSKYTCFQLVSDESANPSFQTEARHEFISLDCNHWETCKPVGRDDLAYQKLVNFIRNCTAPQGEIEETSP